MRRLAAVVTAVSFAMAAPAFAQSAPANSTPSQTAQSTDSTAAKPLLLDGQDAMAQDAGGNNGLWIALGIGGTVGLVAWAISQSNKHSTSP